MFKDLKYISYYKKKNSRWMAWLFVVFAIFFVAILDVWAGIPIIRVGIFLDHKEILINSDKGCCVYQLPDMKKMFIQQSNQPLKMIANFSGITINGQSHAPIKKIKIVPNANGLIQVNNRKYRGEIEIIIDNSLLNVINVIDMEQYLYGVLKKEISPDWPQEVLKAQAIAARTFALFNMNKYIDQGYNLCATTNSQAYGGVYHEDPATNKAVNDTCGIIVTYQDKPINAVYHSDSGGCTENSEDVWGSHVPYLRSKVSDYEKRVSPPRHKWIYSLTQQEVLAKLNQNGFKIKTIDRIAIGEKTEAGRVKSVLIFGDNQSFNLKTNDFRLLMGPALIRSSLFTVDTIGQPKDKDTPAHVDVVTKKEGENKQQIKPVKEILKENRNFSISELIHLLNRTKEGKEPPAVELKVAEEKKLESGLLSFTFNGMGNGHGVGLSQWGAYGMALDGYNYEDILKYYYQDIELDQIY